MKNRISIYLLGISILLMSMTGSSPAVLPTSADDSLSEYVGTYKMKENGYFSVFKITFKEGALFGEADENGANKLLKQEKPDTFKSTSQYGSIITFKRNTESKKVVGLSLLIQETEMLADKQ